MNRDEALKKMQEWLDEQDAGAVPGEIPGGLRAYLADHPDDAVLWETLKTLEDDLRRIERETLAAPARLHEGIMEALRRETGVGGRSRPVATGSFDNGTGRTISETDADRKRVRIGRVGRITRRAPLWPVFAAAATLVLVFGLSLLMRPGFEERTAVLPTPRPAVAFNIPDIELLPNLPPLEKPIAKRGRQLADYGRTVLEQATEALGTVQSLTPPAGEGQQPISQKRNELRAA